jgi:hypothetical protein
MADTAAYLSLGLLVIFGSLSFYVGSLFLRFRGTDRDEDTLHRLRES